MRLNEKGLKDALASLAEADKRIRIMEREAIARAEDADRQLNSCRSLLGHVLAFREAYRAQLDELEQEKENKS